MVVKATGSISLMRVDDGIEIANGKNSIIFSTTAPPVAGRKVDDIWFDTDDGHKMYRFNGTSWVETTFGTSAISANAITANQLAASSVIAGKIAANAIVANNLTSNSITSDKITSNSITSDKINANAVVAGKIAAGAISTTNLQSNVITSDKITAKAITSDKLDVEELFVSDNAFINHLKAIEIDASAITTGKISGDRIDITGLVNFKALDEDLSKLFVPGSQNGTVINGGFIGTDTIKANSIDLYSGLVVRNESGALSFSIAANGDVEVNGLLKSGNYRPGVSGYQVETNGRAEFNEAVIRGSIDLPNAGLTDSGSAELNPVRIWAGASYENRDLAPFKVLQNGSFIALDGTFTGRVYGNYDNDRIHIHDNEIVIDSVSTFINELGEESKYIPMNATSDNPFIKLSSNQSFINTDLVFGSASDKRIEYFNDDKILNSNITIIKTNKRGVIESNSTHYFGPNNTEAGMNILKTSNIYGGSHLIKYWDEIPGMIFESTGDNLLPEKFNEKPYDFKFERTNASVNVKIRGNVEITNSISSDIHNIEMRSISGEGWGFYAT